MGTRKLNQIIPFQRKKKTCRVNGALGIKKNVDQSGC